MTARDVAAGPDACTVIGASAICAGNQSDGVSYSGGAVTSIRVEGLTQPIAPTGGTSGIALQANGGSGVGPGTAGGTAPGLTVSADGTLVTVGAPAIVVSGAGGNGAAGTTAASETENGHPGGAGGSGGSITITNGGALSASNNKVVQPRHVEFGQTADLTKTNNALAVINREAEVRAIIAQYNADNSTTFDPLDSNDRLAVHIALKGKTPPAGFMTTAEEAIYGGLLGAITVFPYMQVGQDDLTAQIADLSAHKTHLENPPLPEEVRDQLNGAIVARSNGGNGANGGEGGLSAHTGATPPVIPTGGAGGNGGAGGTITITNNGTVTATVTDTATQGFNAGILAISQGGNAGNGGGNSIGPGTGFDTIAGGGGIGGAGGAVTVINSGTIKTNGQLSPGIFAQSAGGRGATGGVNGIGQGGAGSAGGMSGAVVVSNSGAITTSAYGSYGIFAQSAGGEGGAGAGNGGTGGIGGVAGNVNVSVSGGVATGGDFAHGVLASSFGGLGGVGGDGGGSGGTGGASGTATVAVSADGRIVTAGDTAHAVYAQSRGGTGGVGDTVRGFWASAGGGGNGGAGGDAVIVSHGLVRTTGDYSYGLFAQALGGAGGYGGDAAGFVSFSGEGGGGAVAGAATVTNTGKIVTSGEGSHAVLAQSVAGGGGDAGSAGGFVALGGHGGSEAEDECRNNGVCNDGGNVTVTNSGRIITGGNFAYGVFAESIGGGGGNGGGSGGLFTFGGDGGAGGNGGIVNVNNNGVITSSGKMAASLFAQSVGGGGGNGGDATAVSVSGASIAIGGSGGTGGDGGLVNVVNNGTLRADGYRATGLFAQSIGGGGGNGGNATAAVIGIPVSVSIGGSGGDGGAGGEVHVDNNGAIVVNGARATGLFAQSVGGGGGSGSAASSFSASLFSVAVAVGGTGGGGGSGDLVDVGNNGTIVTNGVDARGIFAQSVGGGGGHGGAASSIAVTVAPPSIPSVSVSVAVGGVGGDGGAGGAINVDNDGRVTTYGDGSHAVHAQSVGGGGGTGGDASAMTLAAGGKFDVAVAVAVGGTGGSGGLGGNVDVRNDGAIATLGEVSHGIYAQSVGGGGGDGGIGTAQSATFGSGTAKTITMNVAVGGSGGDGGFGGTVDVANNGAIYTAGTGSRAIFAQSVGGGGGAAGGAEGSARANLSLAVTVGGSGGAAGGGHVVTVINQGNIRTAGHDADGIFAQSVGGGGGVGGSVNADSTATISKRPKKTYGIGIGIGGQGGAAGNGAAVLVTNDGSIQTEGANSNGIFAQSVGGGGGAGGGAQSSGSDGSSNFALAIGGRANSAGCGNSDNVCGDGGIVTVTNNGTIVTRGNDSYGILAQSVGGGGGVGGGARAESEVGGTIENQFGALALMIGGTGGAGGDGGAVTVTNRGDIDTAGYGAHGIVAQSVGGGGGIGGGGGAESTDTAIFGAAFNDAFNLAGLSPSVAAQIGVVVGGLGGASGDGGIVTINNQGVVVTRGHDAHGLLAQSIGGGGGIGATGNGSNVRNKSLKVSVGGAAGDSGKGGIVSIAQTGDVVTFGNRSFGVLAQSVGGGGGIGGAGEGNNSGDINVGGGGSDGGAGGTVAVTVTGDVTTFGKNAHAVFAQSVGGGGGIGGGTSGDTFTIGVGGAGGGDGNGGAVNITSAGSIVTNGFRAFGIFAQSVGGGGGVGGDPHGGVGTTSFAGTMGGSGSGGNVTVHHTGSVFALGDQSHAIFAQSTGGSGGRSIVINVQDGTIIGGGGTPLTNLSTGAGIFVDGGGSNNIIIGSKATVSALSGLAIRGTGGDDSVQNSGTAFGSVILGGGINAFLNSTGSNFVTGAIVDLGNDSFVLTNQGTLDIGGFKTVETTALTGTLTQTAAGSFAVDVRFKAGLASDLLTVTGDATLAGIVKPTNLYLMPGFAAPVLNATGALDITAATPGNTPFVTYGLENVADGGTNNLKVNIQSVQFLPAGATTQMTGNQLNLGSHFQSVWNAGGSDVLAPVMGYLVNSLDFATINAALDRLHPEPYLGQVTAATSAGAGFMNSLLSCRGFEGSFAALRENECVWAKFTGGIAEMDGTFDSAGYRESAVRFQSGIQRRLAPDWYLDFGIGYERSTTKVDDRANTGADRFSAGIAIKYQSGPWLFAAAAGYGYSTMETTRSINIPTPALTAESESELHQVRGKFRIAYLAEFSELYLKPYLDFDLVYVNMPGFSETGAGGLNLVVSRMSDTLYSATPMLEFGATVHRDYGTVLRPYVAAGVSFLSKDAWMVSSLFEGTPPGIAPFVTTTSFPDVVARVSAGLEIMNKKGLDVRLQYDSNIGDGYIDHAGGVKFTVRF